MTGAIIAAALSVAEGAATPANPLDSSVSYVLNFGILGIVALALAFRWLVPRGAVEEAREQGRADVIGERDRANARADKAEEQRDEALRFARDQIVPVLSNFDRTAGALVPLLQRLVLDREEHDGGSRRR